MNRKFPHFEQPLTKDCGVTCLRMIANYFGRYYSLESLRSLSNQRLEGTNLLGISQAAEKIGMHTVGAKLTFNRLIDDIPLPGIAHWKETHFVVVVDAREDKVVIADPSQKGVTTISKTAFLEGWVGNQDGENEKGIILLMEPTAEFFNKSGEKIKKSGKKYVWGNLWAHKKLMWFLGIGAFIAALLSGTFPFIIQTMVDDGILNDDKHLLNLILLAWFVLFLSKIGLDLLRHFLLFHVGVKVNIRILTEFMMKMMTLPIRFFRSRLTDDVMQTLYDNPRIQRFFTTEVMSLAIVVFSTLVFSVVLFILNPWVCSVFLAATILQGLAVAYFLKKRKAMNSQRHEMAVEHYSKLTDIITGIEDIKLSSAERTQRWSWERSEARLLHVSKSLTLTTELSKHVPDYIGELRNIFIIYFGALAIVDTTMTMGAFVAILLILTQLGNPLRQVVQFMLGWQETKMSLERMNELHEMEPEETEDQLDRLPENGSLVGDNVSFRYEENSSPWVLRNFDFQIREGKTTAIAGPSGSGKTTLMNLLLNFIQPTEGILKIGDVKLSDIRISTWLKSVGVVQQDGHIFTESISRNIAIGDEVIDSQRMLEAARIANILPFIERLPRGFSTVIGDGGVGLSKGQRQAILIARAIYKKPDYLFLDEATNNLDEENERIVLKRIQEAFRGKTVVIVANRINLPIKIDHIIPLAIYGTVKPKGMLENANGGSRMGTRPDEIWELSNQN